MRILCNILVVLFVTATAVGQQINPVPDYIFRNSMSVGRNAPTDTSAYFSIGPRFGATRGFMPPMVVDTAAVTGTKRNGLLIYSIQRNSFLYWDSTGSRWSRIAANLDTLLLSTRAWRQKGIDSVASVRVGGSGTLNYIPKFTAASTIGNSQIFDNGTNVGVGTTSISGTYEKLAVSGGIALKDNSSGKLEIGRFNTSTAQNSYIKLGPNSNSLRFTNNTDAVDLMIIENAGNVGIGTTSPSYLLDVAGSFRNTTNAFFNTTSGESYLGTNTDLGDFRLQVNGNQYLSGNLAIGNSTLRTYAGTFIPGVQAEGTTTDLKRVLAITSNGGTNAGNPPAFTFGKTRGTSVGSTTAVISGDQLMVVNSYGSDGTNLIESTSISAFADNTVSSNVVPGRLVFSTANTSGTVTEVMRIASDGNVGIATTSASERLHVNGRARIATIDSSASPVNMLWADVNGVIRKTAVPTASVSGGTTDFIPLWSSSTALTSSVIKQVSSEILVDYASDQGAFKLQVNGAALADGGYRSGAPNGGTAATWKLGIVVAGSYTAASNYLQVDVGGTLYYIGLVTPN